MTALVLELINDSSLGGGQTHVLDLAGLVRRGPFRPVVAAAGRGPLRDAALAAGVPYLELPPMGPASLPALRDLIRVQRPAIVHTHGGIAGFWGRLAAFGTGARLVHTLHGVHYLHYPETAKRLAYSAVDAAFARFTDRILCVCESDRRRAIRAGVVVPERTVAIPNGIDVAAVRAQSAAVSGQRAHFRYQKGIAAGEHAVVCVARYHRQKGLPVLLDAFALARRSEPALKLVLAGGGAEQPALERQAAALGIASRVVFWTDAGPAIAAGAYAIADLLCLPSLWEGLPLVLLEAWACGVPVVATAVDGTAEAARDGVDALLVPPRDPRALADALLVLVRDPARARALADAGARRVEQAFDVDLMVQRILAVYDSVTN